jgi:hypothetical protein
MNINMALWSSSRMLVLTKIRCRFWRISVIQECVYATKIVVFCGDVEIEWLNLCSASTAYYQNALLIFHGLSINDISMISAQLPMFHEARAGVIAFHTIPELR